MVLMNTALIVAGGPIDLKKLQQEVEASSGSIIAVDGGGIQLFQLGVRPRVLIGDFDSLTPEVLAYFSNNGVEILRYPEAKDQTDLELAVDWAIDHNIEDLSIVGGLGNRLDHTLGNIGLLMKARQRGVKARLLDATHEVQLVDGRVVLTRKAGWAVSLIPLTVVKGVSTAGLEYPLQNEDLHFQQTRGLHNRFVQEEAIIDLKAGLLLVVLFLEQ